jgi:hypothetical protein
MKQWLSVLKVPFLQKKKKKCFSSKNIFFVLTQNYKCWTVEHHLKRLQNNFFEKKSFKKT